MAAAPTPEVSTAAHQADLPRVLAFAPALAAAHVLRVRRLQASSSPSPSVPHRADPPLFPTHCLRCGHYLYDGAAAVRVRRDPLGSTKTKRRNESARMRSVHTRCGVCAYVAVSKVKGDEDDDTGRARFPKAREHKRQKVHGIASLPTLSSASSPTSAPPTKRAQQSPAPAPPRPIARVASSPVPTEMNVRPSPVDTRQPKMQTASPSAVPGPPTIKNKARPKKKSGLQDLLARNREKQERDRRGGPSGGGLAAFLSGL